MKRDTPMDDSNLSVHAVFGHPGPEPSESQTDRAAAPSGARLQGGASNSPADHLHGGALRRPARGSDGVSNYVVRQTWVDGWLHDPVLNEFRIKGVASPMGTGKTQGVARRLDGAAAVTCVSFRRTLVRTMAVTFRAAHYEDAHDDPDLRGGPRFATTLHSLARLRTRAWSENVVVIDEITAFLRCLAADETIEGGSKLQHGADRRKHVHRRIGLTKLLSHILRAAKEVWLLDADLTDEDVASLANLANVPLSSCVFIKNEFVPQRGLAFGYANDADLMARALELRAEGQSIFYTCSTAAGADRVCQAFLARGFADTLLVTASNAQDAPQQQWIACPWMYPYKVVVVSPAISSGFSVDPLPGGRPAFDHVFHSGQLHDPHLNDHRQQIARVRGTPSRYPDVHFWITSRADGPTPSAEDLSNDLWERMQESADLLSHLPEVSGGDAFKLDRRPFDGFLSLWGRCEHDRLRSHRGALQKFAAALRSDGWLVGDQPPRRETPAQHAARTEGSERRLAERVERIRTAPMAPDANSGMDDVAEWHALPPSARSAAREAQEFRRELCMAPYSVPVEVETAILRWRLAKQRDWALIQAVFLDPYIAVKNDLDEFGFARTGRTVLDRRGTVRDGRVASRGSALGPADLAHRQQQVALVHAGLVALGNPVPALRSEAGFTYSKRSVGEFLQWAQRNKATLNALLRIEAPADEDSVCRPVRSLLERVGCEVESEGRGKFRTYTARFPEFVQEALDRRFPEYTEPTDVDFEVLE